MSGTHDDIIVIQTKNGPRRVSRWNHSEFCQARDEGIKHAKRVRKRKQEKKARQQGRRLKRGKHKR